MLRILDELPPGLLDLDAAELADALGGPTLIRVPGARPAPLMVAVLVHGNETTGWNAVRALLRDHEGRSLPRELLLFVGNVFAARERQRRLDGQPDYNRIWRGAPGPEGEMAARVLDEVARRRPFACVDLHNTSGENPLYACVHSLDASALALGRVFSRELVLVTHPDSLLSNALSSVAPSVTLECGKPGHRRVTARVSDYLLRVMAMRELDSAAWSLDSRDCRVLRSVATIRVPEHLSFSFHDDDVDLRLPLGLDHHNFNVLPAGTPIAWVRPGSGARLQALDASGSDVSHRYFREHNGALVTIGHLLPSLLTADARIIRQDCLGYLMESMAESRQGDEH
jgi:hypothetical protein